MPRSCSFVPGFLLPFVALVSCAAPKALVVEEPKPAPAAAAEPGVAEAPAQAAEPDDGIRLPDMLGLPGESEFRHPTQSGTSGSSGAVIARPPVNPPADDE
jgi:hypothetical protein